MERLHAYGPYISFLPVYGGHIYCLCDGKQEGSYYRSYQVNMACLKAYRYITADHLYYPILFSTKSVAHAHTGGVAAHSSGLFHLLGFVYQDIAKNPRLAVCYRARCLLYHHEFYPGPVCWL